MYYSSLIGTASFIVSEKHLLVCEILFGLKNTIEYDYIFLVELKDPSKHLYFFSELNTFLVNGKIN